MAFDNIVTKKYQIHQLYLGGLVYQIFDTMSVDNHDVQIKVDIDGDGTYEWKLIGSIKMENYMVKRKFAFYEDWIRSYERKMIQNGR